jgi:hypothetical protein
VEQRDVGPVRLAREQVQRYLRFVAAELHTANPRGDSHRRQFV